MTSLTFEADFYAVSLSLRDMTDRLHQSFLQFSESSKEVIEEMTVSWKKWSENLEHYKSHIQSMPQELRQRPFVVQTLKNVEAFEAELKHFFTEFKESSFEDFKEKLKITFQESRIKKISDQISELENHPLVSKCLSGETVLSSKKNIQWARKAGHAMFGIVVIYLVAHSGLTQNIIWSLIGGFIFLAFGLETSRHIKPEINKWVIKYFKPVMRESEKTKINSAIFYMISMVTVYVVFPLKVSYLVMLFISIGDPIAGIFGVKFGKKYLSSHVSLEGFLACLVTCALLTAATTIFYYKTPLSFNSLLIFSSIAGLIGAFSEASFKKLDDNLVLPLISAPLLWLLMKGFSIL